MQVMVVFLELLLGPDFICSERTKNIFLLQYNQSYFSAQVVSNSTITDSLEDYGIFSALDVNFCTVSYCLLSNT